MNSRVLVLTAALAGVFGSACTAPVSSSGQALGAPEADVAPRVYVETMLFPEPPGGFGAIGVNPGEMTFGGLVARIGARPFSIGGGVVADDAVMRMPSPEPDAKSPGDSLGGYDLVIKPHVLEGGQVRLDVDLTLASKKATTSLMVLDKQLIIIGTEVMVEDRRVILLVRPNIVRSDAELQALLSRKIEALREETAKASPSR